MDRRDTARLAGRCIESAFKYQNSENAVKILSWARLAGTDAVEEAPYIAFLSVPLLSENYMAIVYPKQGEVVTEVYTGINIGGEHYLDALNYVRKNDRTASAGNVIVSMDSDYFNNLYACSVVYMPEEEDEISKDSFTQDILEAPAIYASVFARGIGEILSGEKLSEDSKNPMYSWYTDFAGEREKKLMRRVFSEENFKKHEENENIFSPLPDKRAGIETLEDGTEIFIPPLTDEDFDSFFEPFEPGIEICHREEDSIDDLMASDEELEEYLFKEERSF